MIAFDLFMYVLGSLIVSIGLYIEWYDKEPTILDKVYMVVFILASWYTITAIAVLTILLIIDIIFTKKMR